MAKKNELGMIVSGASSAVLAKLQNGTYGNWAEALDFSYYDTQKIATAKSTYDFFAQPQGSQLTGGGTKTLADTNMTTPGTMPQGSHLEVNAIKIMYSAKAAKSETFLVDLYKFLSESTLRLIVNGKDTMGTYKLQELLGTATLAEVTPSVAGDNISQIQPTYQGIFPLNIPLVIGALTNFGAVLENHTTIGDTLADDEIVISFNGLLLRSA